MSIVNVASLRQVVDARHYALDYPGRYVQTDDVNASTIGGWHEISVWNAHLSYTYQWSFANLSDYFWNNYYCAASSIPPPSNQHGATSADVYLIDPAGSGGSGNWTDVASTAWNAFDAGNIPTGLLHITHTMQAMKATDSSNTTLPPTMDGAAGNGGGTWSSVNVSMGKILNSGNSGGVGGFKFKRTAPSWRQLSGDSIEEHFKISQAGTISFGDGCGSVTQPAGPPPA